MPAPTEAIASAPSRPTWPWLLVAASLVVARTWPYAWWGTLAFDGDQAVVGLMAKHVAELRAFPVYQYALSYVVMVTAWITAPFMWVLGATPFALKLPLVLMNVGVGVGLVMLAREGLSFAALKRMEDDEEASAEDALEELGDDDEEAFEDEDADRYVTPLRSRR